MLIPLRRGGPIRPPTREDKIRRFIAKAIVFIGTICFGWIGWILGRLMDRNFTNEIRAELSFLFSEHGAYFLPQEQSKYATKATVAVGAVRLLFSRHHGEFYVSVSSEFTPGHWEEFGSITQGYTQWGGQRREPYHLDTFEPILRRHLPFLESALSRDNAESTMNRAVEAHNASLETYAERARMSGIEPIIRTLDAKIPIL